MTPKDKAKELIDSYYDKIDDCCGRGIDYEYKLQCAKQCALVALDLLLYYSESPEAFIEFEEIKKEIEAL